MPHILIIGAGLGGLALAQALRAKDIPFTIFERSDQCRAQGWALSLHDWFVKTQQAPKTLTKLRPDIWNRFIESLISSTKDDMPSLDTVSNTYELGIPSEAAIFDAASMREYHRWGGPKQNMIRANRSRLRNWLLTGIAVQYSKRFTHYSGDGSGVTAYFSDSSSYRGDILVGADGVSSHVRDQLLPDSPENRPQALPTGVIVGQLTATKEQYQRWMKTFTPSLFIGLAGHRHVAIGLKEISKNLESAGYYWIFGWNDPKACEDDLWTQAASQEAMHSFILSNLSGIHENFTEIFHATPVEGMLHPPLRLKDMVPPPLPHGRVTLVGDAVHAMTPFRGQGGNMAMQDGLSLAKCIGAAADGQRIEDMLKAYEADMIPRATKAVLESRGGREFPKEEKKVL